ncbi:hypothetical protein B0H19DRAFT_533722 [Mycena capillaripes]|nr:hypothetical protein B0H19DRAFT_533722 [Mycena capillaripes]
MINAARHPQTRIRGSPPGAQEPAENKTHGFGVVNGNGDGVREANGHGVAHTGRYGLGHANASTSTVPQKCKLEMGGGGASGSKARRDETRMGGGIAGGAMLPALRFRRRACPRSGSAGCVHRRIIWIYARECSRQSPSARLRLRHASQHSGGEPTPAHCQRPRRRAHGVRFVPEVVKQRKAARIRCPMARSRHLPHTRRTIPPSSSVRPARASHPAASVRTGLGVHIRRPATDLRTLRRRASTSTHSPRPLPERHHANGRVSARRRTGTHTPFVYLVGPPLDVAVAQDTRDRREGGDG